MPHYYVKLIPPRPTFADDITPDERALMGAHSDYTREIFDAGSILAYGPVLAAEGSFGIALVELPDEHSVRAFLDHDPTIKSGLMRYEISPMRIAGSQPSRRELTTDK